MAYTRQLGAVDNNGARRSVSYKSVIDNGTESMERLRQIAIKRKAASTVKTNNIYRNVLMSQTTVNTDPNCTLGVDCDTYKYVFLLNGEVKGIVEIPKKLAYYPGKYEYEFNA